jgi:hypothetical protein
VGSHNGSWGIDTSQGVQWDESGKPYFNTTDGLRSYISPDQAVQGTADSRDPRLNAYGESLGAHYDPTSGNYQSAMKPGGLFHSGDTWNNEKGQIENPIAWGNILGLAIGGGIGAEALLPALGGAGAAAGGGAASAGESTGMTAAELAAAPGLGSTAPGVVAGSSIGSGGAMSGIGSALSKIGLDPTSLILGTLKLLGGPQKLKSFEGTGATDPRTALLNALQADYRTGQNVMDRKPVSLRSYLPKPASPVYIPGLNVQLGGGLGDFSNYQNPYQDNPAFPSNNDPLGKKKPGETY